MAAPDLPAGLLQDVETYLDITWSDQATDAKVTELINGGMAYINDKLGAVADYTAPGYPRSLLLDYVRYARSAALDVFEANYTHLLLAMQQKRMMDDAAQTIPPGQ